MWQRYFQSDSHERALLVFLAMDETSANSSASVESATAPSFPPAVASGGDGDATNPTATSHGVDGAQKMSRKRPEKVIIKLKAAANAPVLRENFRKCKLSASEMLTRVAEHIEKLLKDRLQNGNRIFLYVSSAKSNFSPSLDQTVGNLYMCFGRESGKNGNAVLELTYTVTPSWG